MATTVATLVQRTRRLVRDMPELDTLTASMSSAATSITVADGTLYPKNMLIEVEQELMRVTATGSGTTAAVQRAAHGSTAATHVTASIVLMNPAFYAVEIVDALSEAIQASFPLIYKRVTDTSLSVISNTYEYTIPGMPADATVVIPYLSRLGIKETGDLTYRSYRRWDVIRDQAPILKFRSIPPVGAQIRLEGYGPFPLLTAVTDSLDAQYPRQAEHLPPMYAASVLLASGEAGAARVDTGLPDARENARRTGASMQIANNLMQRWRLRLADAALPPMPRHVVPTF